MVASAAQLEQIDLDPAGVCRYVRVELGLTQREFGRLLGVTQHQVSTWENNHARAPHFKEQILFAFANAIDRAPLGDVSQLLAQCGPTYTLWHLLDAAYCARHDWRE